MSEITILYSERAVKIADTSEQKSECDAIVVGVLVLEHLLQVCSVDLPHTSTQTLNNNNNIVICIALFTDHPGVLARTSDVCSTR